MLVSGSFGAVSPEHGGECSVGDFDGKPGGWEQFCDCMWKDRIINAKCRSKPGIAAFMAPWTGVGAGLRDIPGPAEWRFMATVLDPLGLFKPKIVEEEVPLTAAEIARQQLSAARQPAWVMPVAIGGGVLFMGLAAVMILKKPKPKAVAGYRRRQ